MSISPFSSKIRRGVECTRVSCTVLSPLPSVQFDSSINSS
ncbi:hypothetical protein X975_26675, partial [Stegodyphus mimosarum]